MSRLLVFVLLAGVVQSTFGTDPPTRSDDAQTVQDDRSEATIGCPCAGDYAEALAIYDVRPGIPEGPQWAVCSVPRNEVNFRDVRTHKFDALTPSEEGRTTTIVLNAARVRNLWGTHRVQCLALVFTDRRSVSKWLYSPKAREGLSVPELSACENLILAIASCPE